MSNSSWWSVPCFQTVPLTFYLPRVHVKTDTLLALALDWLVLVRVGMSTLLDKHWQKVKIWHCIRDAKFSKRLAVSRVESCQQVSCIVEVNFGYGALAMILKAHSDCTKALLLFRNPQQYFTMAMSETWSKLTVADDIQAIEQCCPQDSILFPEGYIIVIS